MSAAPTFASLLDDELDRRATMARQFARAGDRHAAIEHLRHNPVDFINDWAWTYDPRNRDPLPKRMPFGLWPRQRELVGWLQERVALKQNGLLKKARDIGATWLMAAFGVWMWLFEEESAVTYGSRKQDLVDKLGDKKTIFSKIRDVIEYLPAWLKPKGYQPSKHDKFLNIVNPENGSVITGEAGDDMGRGGRSSIYFLDEFAYVPRAESVDAAVNDNADTVIYLSTSAGAGTLFHQKELDRAAPVFHFFWFHDPRKDEAWKQQKIKDTSPATFAREHEGDDSSALDRQLIQGAWVKAAQRIRLGHGRPVAAGLDVADEGTDENVFVLRRGPVVSLLPEWVWTDELPGDTGRRAINLVETLGASVLNYDRVGVGSGVATEVARSAQATWRAQGIVGNAKCTSICYDDDPERPAKERFRYLITELWWALRQRFIKTYEVHQARLRGQEDPHPEDECISIPADTVLETQLVSRVWKEVEAGKIAVESKKEMRKRGVKSPDRADALVYCFAPTLGVELPTFTHDEVPYFVARTPRF